MPLQFMMRTLLTQQHTEVHAIQLPMLYRRRSSIRARHRCLTVCMLQMCRRPERTASWLAQASRQSAAPTSRCQLHSSPRPAVRRPVRSMRLDKPLTCHIEPALGCATQLVRMVCSKPLCCNRKAWDLCYCHRLLPRKSRAQKDFRWQVHLHCPDLIDAISLLQTGSPRGRHVTVNV
jgi:hypothetical protein